MQTLNSETEKNFSKNIDTVYSYLSDNLKFVHKKP